MSRVASLLEKLKTDPRVKPESVAMHWLANGEDFGRSVSNCHTPGLDSVVLLDEPGGGMIRFYYAHGGQHTMHRMLNEHGHFTVGIHNHKYEIAKIPLSGPIINLRTKVLANNDPSPSLQLWEYTFASALKGGGMEVQRRHSRRASVPQPDLMMPGEMVIMLPEDLHTVLVPPNVDVAWMVIEGPPVDIESLIYSPRPDLSLSTEGLYDPMTKAECLDRIRSIRRSLMFEWSWRKDR